MPKLLFTSLDLLAALNEIRERVIGMRINNVYDINNKTYLLKLTSSDRIVDIEIGFGEHAFHLITELYDRGNMFLTDHQLTILHLLRPRTDQSRDVRFAANQLYPVDQVRPCHSMLGQLTDPTSVKLLTSDPQRLTRLSDYIDKELLVDKALGPWSDAAVETDSKDKDNVRLPVQKVLSTEFAFGNVAIEHCCRLAKQVVVECCESTAGSSSSSASSTNNLAVDVKRACYAQRFSTELLKILSHACLPVSTTNQPDLPHGFILARGQTSLDSESLVNQDEFHAYLFDQHRNRSHLSFDTFNKAVDTYFSHIESQKATNKLLQSEIKANKKLQNVRKDHDERLMNLQRNQVDNILLMLNHALSNQVDWSQLDQLLEEARQSGNQLARHVVRLDLQYNQAVLRLGYYDKKKAASKKEEKTLEATNKALKSAKQKVMQSQKDRKNIVQISKVRKTHWFEKFFWFISSENYLVVAGRDAQQNEVLVKRYLKPGDLYVHADLHGASSVIVKARQLTPDELASRPGGTEGSEVGKLTFDNPSSSQQQSSSTPLPLPPPKTIEEAGTMAVIYSSAWQARVVAGAWWVRHDQVSKTAPTGEYLGLGSFMIRGRKNYLPPCQLIYGFGMLFKLDEDSVERHKNDRRIVYLVTSDNHAVTGQPIGQTESDQIDDSVSAAEPSSDPFQFPDSHLPLELTSKKMANLNVQSNSSANSRPSSKGKQKPANQAVGRKDSSTNKDNRPQPPIAEPVKPPACNKSGPLKRGQKAKLKRIKAKYANQDEDERELRMKLLQGESGKPSKSHLQLINSKSNVVDKAPSIEGKEEQDDTTTNTPDQDGDTAASQNEEQDTDNPITESGDDGNPSSTAVNDNQIQDEDADEEEEAEGDRVGGGGDDLAILSTYTGQPIVDEDQLLYALPVCAPYPALVNYKFKVKLTPGVAKRGKASKLALQTFVSAGNKLASLRERDLMRVVRDEDLAHNFPGQVKLTLPQSIHQAVKKQKKRDACSNKGDNS